MVTSQATESEAGAAGQTASADRTASYRAPVSHAAAAPGVGPFVGTRPFEGADKAFFFGREQEAQELANMVAACPLTVVYGPSGAGKSSMLNARLLDELANIDPDWVAVTFLRWQPGFESALLTAISQALGTSHTAGGSLDGVAQFLLDTARVRESPILLILDQFEEYFLYHSAGLPAFETMLAKLVNRRDGSVHILLSLRSDRLFLLDRLRRRSPHILQNLFLVDPLNTAGSIDAVRKPIAEYNALYGADIAVQDGVVDAVVRGADEYEIFQRLPFRGRGGARQRGPGPASTPRSSRIVAPFLQLALEALWREDIEARGGRELTLKSLRALAGANDAAPAETLVGLLAQRHLDNVLSSRSEPEQAICATLFYRMVTYSGGKVAVELEGDFSSLLSADELKRAKTLLDEMSAGGSNCLVRRVAVGDHRLLDGSAGPIAEHFEIVHDALAVPILDWVRRWRENRARVEAAEREHAAAARKSWRWRIAFAGIALLASTLWLYNEFRGRSETMHRIATFNRIDPAPEFRLRLLLGIASLQKTSGPWRLVLDGKPAREALRTTLLRSPRYGGTYRGAGVDEAGTRLVRTADSAANVIEVVALRDGTVSQVKLPKDLMQIQDTQPQSRSKKLQMQRMPEILLGFLRGIDGPVILQRGLLYYQAGAAGAAWQKVDLADFLPSGFEDLPNLAWVELTAGAVQITTQSPSGNEMQVLRLRPKRAPDSTVAIDRTAPITLVKWRGQRFQPALSPWLERAPHDRFAYLNTPEGLGGGQLLATQLLVGNLTATAAEEVVWEEPARLPSDRAQSLLTSAETPAPASLAFTSEGGGLVLRTGSKVTVLPLPDPALEPIPAAARKAVLSFQVPEGAGKASAVNFTRPLIAAVRTNAEPGHGPGWRFAWPDSAGVALLTGADDGELHLDRFGAGNTKFLLSGLAGGFRLNFSTDGAFLVMQMPVWPDRQQQIRIWDLRPERSEEISKAAQDDATLIQLACKTAAIELGGQQLRDDERVAWLDPRAPEPCAR